MTPGKLFYTEYRELMLADRQYLPRYDLLDVEKKAAWEAAASTVAVDLIAEIDRLRRQLERAAGGAE